MKQLLGILILAMASAALVTGTVKAADTPPVVKVDIYNYKFDPETVTVSVGTTIVWTNKDEIPHTVASSDKSFPGSPGLDTGDSYSYTFTKAGSYEYYCTLHPFMKGKVIVTSKD